MIDINENIAQNLTDANGDLAIFLPHELSDKEKFDLFVKFDQMRNTGLPKSEDVFAILYNYFNENQFSSYFIEKYYDTYWLLFVKISWGLLPRLQLKYLVETVARTLPYAVAQYIDVKNKFSEVLVTMDAENGASLYKQIKQKLLSLDYPISFNEYGKNITISQLVKKINEQATEKDPARFSMFEEIKKAIFPDIPADYEAAKNDTTKRTKEFIELMYFFVKDSNVETFKDVYFDQINKQVGLKMSKEVKSELGARVLTEYFASEEGEKKTETETSLNEKPFLTDLPNHKTDFAIWSAEAGTLRSLLGWLGSFVNKPEARRVLADNLAKVLGAESLLNNDVVMAIAHLDEFLVKNGYRGDDFMHFDEKEGKFKWGR